MSTSSYPQRAFQSAALAFSLLLLGLSGPQLAVAISHDLGITGMQPLEDVELQAVDGEGLAIVLEDFRWMTKPTSYFEQVGQPAPSGSVFTRGDLRWYGVNISGAGSGGYHWNEQDGGFGTACDASSLSCPRGGVIDFFSPHDNPYLIRAFSPEGMSYTGSLINSNPSNPTKTIYEFLAPSNQPDYTFSFWGEIESGKNSGIPERTGNLKSQTIIRGSAKNSAFRLFQFTNPADPTFAILYHSHLQGDFRFSFAQQGTTSDAIGTPVRFEGQEGLHFMNVDAYLPLGQLYYQAMTLDTVGTDGNFKLSLNKLPNTPAVFNRHYQLRTGDTAGYETARYALHGSFLGNTDYQLTHGYVRWGDGGWMPNCNNVTGNLATGCLVAAGGPNAYNNSTQGMFFRSCASCGTFRAFADRVESIRLDNGSIQRSYYNASLGHVTGSGANAHIMTNVANIGNSRMEGLVINHMRFESCMGGAVC